MGIQHEDNPLISDDDALHQPPTRRKRKNAAGSESKDISKENSSHSENLKRKRSAKAEAATEEKLDTDDSSIRRKRPRPDEEKRMKRFRSKAPQSYLEVLNRANSQRMFVIDRTRGGTEACPEETVDIAGTTGNIYTINITKAPSCTCPHAAKGYQCKHIVYILVHVLKAPAHLQYQVALLSSELREIFAKAPPIATAEAATGNGKRRPIGDDCPICCMQFEPATEEIVYCKATCGNNIHRDCFEQWAASKRSSSSDITCPFCRQPWTGDEETLKKIAKSGKTNADGYVNVASQLGLSGRRDYSTYNPFWVRQQAKRGVDVGDWYDD